MAIKGTAAVTGAGQGIGFATSVEFLKRGYSVLALVLLDEHRDGLEQAAKDLPGQLEVQRLDVTAPGEFAFPDDLGVLVNNAGVRFKNLPIEAIPLDEWRQYFEINVLGAIELCRRAIPVLRSNGRGVICNINSSSSALPFPFLGPYRATKGALGQFSETLRAEVTQFGIRVLEILPGGVKTGLATSSMATGHLGMADQPHYDQLAKNLGTVLRSGGGGYVSAEEAGVTIVDAIEERPGRFRYGTDAYSDGLIEQWRAGGGDPLMRDWIARFSPEPRDQ